MKPIIYILLKYKAQNVTMLMVKEMKKINVIVACLSLLSIVVLIIVTALVFTIGKQNQILQLLEIIFSFLSTIFTSSTISLSVAVKMQNSSAGDINGASELKQIQQGDNGNVSIIDNSTHNDPEFLIRAFQEQVLPLQEENIKNIAEVFSAEIKKAGEKNIQQPNVDFFLKYMNEGSLINEHDIQTIWAKLLVQETKQQGSISKLTLDIVKNMNSNDALFFNKVANLSFDDGSIFKNFCNDMNFVNLTEMQDIGLLKGNEFIKQSMEIKPNQSSYIIQSELFFLIKNNSSSITHTIEWGCYMLTKTGIEIRNALNICISQDTFIEFCKAIKSQYSTNKDISFSLHMINCINNKGINYNTNDLLGGEDS